jgi:hypothetical protein
VCLVEPLSPSIARNTRVVMVILLGRSIVAASARYSEQIAEPPSHGLHIVDRFGIGTGQVACDEEAQFHLVHVTELSEGLGSTEHPVERFRKTRRAKSGLADTMCPLACRFRCSRSAGDALVRVADLDQGLPSTISDDPGRLARFPFALEVVRHAGPGACWDPASSGAATPRGLRDQALADQAG